MKGEMNKELMTPTKVFLTADRTLMSNYRNDEFLGFGTTTPFQHFSRIVF